MEGPAVLVREIPVQVRAPQLFEFIRGPCEHTFAMPGYTEAQARAAVAESRSYSEALRWLGMRVAGGNHALFRKYVDVVWRIPTDHFDPYAATRARSNPKPLEEILVKHSPYDRGTLKRRLFNEGLKERACELCCQGEIWRGRRMALILDHINGVPDDNRLENLRIVCPNCAATFDTHCARNNRKAPMPRPCGRCGEEFFPNRREQRYCSRECGSRWDRTKLLKGVPRPEARKVERPPYGQLMGEIAATSYLAVGRKYGVSDNAIRKWVRQYERERELAGQLRLAA